jgi:hypothetical protein
LYWIPSSVLVDSVSYFAVGTSPISFWNVLRILSILSKLSAVTDNGGTDVAVGFSTVFGASPTSCSTSTN